jgi:deazaflavin-dependent oxidoreductase (nitroreductase family)
MAVDRPQHWFTPRGKVLKAWVAIHLWLYRRSRGRLLYRMRGMPTLLLTTTGRRSGRRHTVPLPYLVDPVTGDPAGGDAKVVVGSFAGSDRHPAWVLNLLATPEVGVVDRADEYPARAEVLGGDHRSTVWAVLVAKHPWYADYQAATAREIPLVRVTRRPGGPAAGRALR